MILSSSYEVLTAEGGNGALEILRERPVDLVTVDLNMPGIKGDQLVGIIRQEFAETEIIIITGCATVDAAVSGIRCGVSDFLTKPFDVVQVNAAVNRALHRQQGRRRLVRFLEDLGNVVGRDRTTEDILCELEGSEELQARLQTLLEDPHIESHASREHAGIGERLLQPLALASAITSALRHHHERWDGMGYPDGLRAEETPLLARVVAVADAFDAIVCKQQEAQNDSRRFALSELKAGAGSQFDAQVVGVFCEIAQVEIPEQRDSVAPSSAKLSRAFVEGAGEADRKGFAQ
jgi:response regulator RpfG family c-di-GMP phosphodiesterase